MSEFDAVFATLRQIMLGVAGDQVIERDLPGDLVVRTDATDAETGKPGWFGTVTVRKSYVAYHLMPLYTTPALAEDISPALQKRRQGKTCFNFKSVDQVLFDELAALTSRAYATLV